MNRTQKLIDTIARLNPDAGEIGAGMLAQIVTEARAIQAEPTVSTVKQRCNGIVTYEGRSRNCRQNGAYIVNESAYCKHHIPK